MEDGFAAFERLATTAELRSVFVVESPDKNLEVDSDPNHCKPADCYFIKFLELLPILS